MIFAIFSMLLTIGLSLTALMMTLTCSDIEADIRNPIDAANRINQLLVFEYSLLSALLLSSLFYASWIFILLVSAVAAVLLYFFYMKQHFVDPVRMFDEPYQEKNKKFMIGKTVIYTLILFFALFNLLHEIIQYLIASGYVEKLLAPYLGNHSRGMNALKNFNHPSS